MAKDLFAPPTEDEIKSLAPPTGEELASIAPVADVPKEYGTIETLGRSALSGATMGFDDEIGGLALASVKQGDPRDFWDIYGEIRDSLRKEKEAIATQSPVLSTTGELIGGLAATALTPLGALGTAAKGASLGQKLGAMTKAGAAAGAIAGLGGSTTDLTTGAPENILQAAGETAVGGAIGGTAGFGGQLLGSGVAKVGKEFAKGVGTLPFTRQVGELAKRTFSGEELLGKTTQMAEETRDTAGMFLNMFKELQKVTGKEYGDAFKELEKSGEKVDYKKLSNFLENEVNTLKPKGEANKTQIESLKSTINDILGENQIISTGEASMLPKVGMSPKNIASEKIESQVAAAAKKDEVQLDKLLQMAEELAPTPGEDAGPGYMRILGKIKSVEERMPVEFPPEVATEALTGRTVHAVPRGIGTPIAVTEARAPIMQMQKEITPLSASPEQAKSSLSALSDYINAAKESGSGIGEVMGVRAKGAVKEALDEATANQPQIKEAISTASQRLGNVKQGLEQLGPTGDLNSTLDRLEQAVRQYHKPGSAGQRDVNLALTELEKSFPAEASEMKKRIMNASSREDLSRALSGVSAFGKGLKETLQSGDILGATGAGVHASALQSVRLGTMAARGLVDTAQKATNVVANTGKELYNMTPDQLKGLADFAIATGGKAGGVMGSTIQKLMSEPMGKRKALLFTIMQQPDARELIRRYGAEVSGTEK